MDASSKCQEERIKEILAGLTTLVGGRDQNEDGQLTTSRFQQWFQRSRPLEVASGPQFLVHRERRLAESDNLAGQRVQKTCPSLDNAEHLPERKFVPLGWRGQVAARFERAPRDPADFKRAKLACETIEKEGSTASAWVADEDDGTKRFAAASRVCYALAFLRRRLYVRDARRR
jgi:hypothetical protein